MQRAWPPGLGSDDMSTWSRTVSLVLWLPCALSVGGRAADNSTAAAPRIAAEVSALVAIINALTGNEIYDSGDDLWVQVVDVTFEPPKGLLTVTPELVDFNDHMDATLPLADDSIVSRSSTAEGPVDRSVLHCDGQSKCIQFIDFQRAFQETEVSIDCAPDHCTSLQRDLEALRSIAAAGAGPASPSTETRNQTRGRTLPTAAETVAQIALLTKGHVYRSNAYVEGIPYDGETILTVELEPSRGWLGIVVDDTWGPPVAVVIPLREAEVDPPPDRLRGGEAIIFSCEPACILTAHGSIAAVMEKLAAGRADAPSRADPPRQTDTPQQSAA
jgi:hypothetical protein